MRAPLCARCALRKRYGTCIEGEVNEFYMPISIETGINRCVIRLEFVNDLILQEDEQAIKFVNRTMESLGKVDLKIKSCDFSVTYTFAVVENLVYPCIFGRDILKQYKASCDFGNETFTIDGKSINLVDRPCNIEQIHLDEGVVYLA